MNRKFLTRAIQRTGRRLGMEIRRSANTIGNMEAFLRHVRRLGFVPTGILDVGACKTDWSRLARRYFPHARFTLIEPQLEMQTHLEAFCAETPGSRWQLAAAGSKAGEKTLTVWPDGVGSSLLTPVDGIPREQRRVPIVTIDSLFADGEELPQLAKLDVQGYELEALRGAERLFGHTECFVVETSLFASMPGMPLLADVVAFFDQRGYRVYDIAGFLRRPLDGALGQIDVVFVRKQGMLGADSRWNAR